MRYIPISLLLSVLALPLHCQVITGKVLDESNSRPLAYVSIGVKDAPIGTITDEKGSFKLEIKGQSAQALVRFSMIGYKSQTFSIGDLSNKENIIKLKTEPVQLPEVIIKPSGRIKKVGTTNYTPLGGYCGWGGTDFGKGWEIGTKLELGTVPVKLTKLHLLLSKQSFDTVLFRLHMRTVVNGLPDQELLNNNILIVVAKKSGWIDIDLSKYNLVFKDDIALSLEWIKVVGLNKDRLMKMNGSKVSTANILFHVKKKQGCTYARWGSEAKWTRTENESPSFYVTVQE
ncbi:MAG: carboxypeptidase-like regulatory domain-containing protein [Bacteroidetes bacterium]|nr:carboxypeptidase-like regulatory domain-containing protein [Bacteroidota bacterium]